MIDSPNITTFGATVNVSCVTGYEPNITENCGPPPVPLNGFVSLGEDNSTLYNDRAFQICDDVGFEGANQTIICLDGGWSESPLNSCVEIDCGNFPYVANGMIDSPNITTFGATVNVSCVTGYEPNITESMCLETGQWEPVNCSRKDCGTFPLVENGFTDSNMTTYGAVVNISCINGYEPNVTNSTCLSNGQWEGVNCSRKDCGNFPYVANGMIDSPNITTFGATVNVSCVTGYEPNITESMCLETGQWEPVNCSRKDCGTFPLVQNGFTDSNNMTTYGAVVNISCINGYEPNVTKSTCLSNGQWEGVNCSRKDCGNFPYVANGMIDSPNITTFGATVNVSCVTGYEPNITESMCLETGQWEPVNCSRKDCGTFPLVQNGFTDSNNMTTYGAVVNISCINGYEPNVTKSTCLSNGQWEGVNCSRKDCGPPPGPLNGSVSLDENNSTLYEARAFQLCDGVGLEEANQTIICLDGGWSASPLQSCVEIDCGPLSDPSNGYVLLPDGSKYTAIAEFVCRDGYIPIGDNTSTCLSNGQWENAQFVCASTEIGVVKCQPDHDHRGTFWNEIIANSTRTQNCISGYSGTMERYCSITGRWLYPKYNCIREVVNNIYLDALSLNEFSTEDDIVSILDKGLAVNTNSEYLTDGEIRKYGEMLHEITSLVSNVPADIYNNHSIQVATEFYSSLFDNNVDSWRALSESNDATSDNILAAVELTEELISKNIDILLGTNKLLHVTSNNIDTKVQKVQGGVEIVFDEVSFHEADETIPSDGEGQTPSQIRFNPSALPAYEGNYVLAVTTYRNMTNVLPPSNIGQVLDGKVMSFSIYPPVSVVLDPPLELQFQLRGDEKFTKPACSYWQFVEGDRGYWSSDGCTTTQVSMLITECSCNHATNFGVILSLQDCGTPSLPPHGDVRLDNTTYSSVAVYSCQQGYQISGNTSTECLYNGSWSYSSVQCNKLDCGTLGNPENGRIDLSNGTKYGSTVVYSCNVGYDLIGYDKRSCLQNGDWDYIEPKCVKKEVEIVKCPRNTDSRGLVWSEVLAGQTPKQICTGGYTGNVTRQCNSEGVWKLPQYNCYREQVQNVVTQVTDMDNTSSKEDIELAVNEITSITTALTPGMVNDTIPETDKLTGGEIQALSSALEKVGELMNSNTDLVTEDITDNVISSVDNLIDVEKNPDSLTSLKQGDSGAAEAILKTMSSVGEVIGKTLNNARNKTVVKKNLALEVQRYSTADVIFPEPKAIDVKDVDKQWLRETKSQIKLESESLKDDTVEYVIAAIMYKNIGDILPDETQDDSDENESTETYTDEATINGPVLALTISPKANAPQKFNPPIRITFEHSNENLTNPICSFRKFQDDGGGTWSPQGCWVNTTNDYLTICECDHLTNFAVLMSPFSEVDSTSLALRIISMIGIGISTVCVLITFLVHLCVWRYVRNDRTTILMNLCISLFFAYVVFLAGIERTESKVVCAFIAGLLQYLYLVVFCIMLVEGIEIAVTVLYVFKTKSRIKIMLIAAWVLPGIIVAISAGSTQGVGYGSDIFCWLSIDNGLIWSFVGPVLFIILFNIICIILVLRAMLGTSTMESKKTTEKLKSSVRSLCVLVPVMGISWILGLLQIDDGFIFVQVIFTILNGLQGLFIFIFHCLCNVQVRKGCLHLERRRSSTAMLKSTFRSSSKENPSKLRDTKRSSGEHSDYRSSGEFASHSDSGAHDWRKTALQPMIKPEEIKFTSPIVTMGVGRPAASFSQHTRANLSSNGSTSK
ncbi:G-protein coupled receptor 2 [Mactra antiquata]